MKKSLIIATMILFSIPLFSLDDFEKVYSLKIDKSDFYNYLELDEKQQKNIDKLDNKYESKINQISNDTRYSFEEKKEKLGEIEEKKMEKIYSYLSEDQQQKYNSYIIKKKESWFEQKKFVENTIEQLELTNDQKSDLLKAQRDFKNEIENLANYNFIDDRSFIHNYMKAKDTRNNKFNEILTEEQLKSFVF